MCKRSGSILILVLFFAVIAVNGFSSQMINYQGRLTDNAGNPVANGYYTLTFTIYGQGLPVPLWTSGPQNVYVSNGLLNYKLGSSNPIPESVFDGGMDAVLELGIKVGSDPEIYPRTMLTSSPFAAVAGRVAGSLESGEGFLELKNTNGDSLVVFAADDSSGSMTVNGISEGGKGLFRAFRITANSTGSRCDFNNVIGKYMGVEPSPFHDGGRLVFPRPGLLSSEDFLLSIDADPSFGATIKMFDPQPEPPGQVAVKIGMNGAKAGPGAYLRLNNTLTSYHADPVIEMRSIQNGGASWIMYDPLPEPSGRQAIAFNTDPTLGFSIRMFDPQPEPPGRDAISMFTSGAKGSGGNITVKNFSDSISSVVEGGTFALSSFKAAGGPLLSMSLKADTSRLVLTSYGTPPFVNTIALRTDYFNSRIGIGTLYPNEALHVIGNIIATGSITEYATKDTREVTGSIENALEMVAALNGVRYNGDQIGLISDDVEKVLPELVRSDSDGSKLVAYSRLTAVLVEAIKELKAENESLIKRIDALER
ncbi:MAG: hypothetical protein CVT49_15480 [candidate division Zixibacteria bacterium HGW-Zixibacteria-1]|nr:MAG: hypothetical protein CVT49_15480 [candidate division Zixibacteria bacterium HGW-Zixibacteria-1]